MVNLSSLDGLVNMKIIAQRYNVTLQRLVRAISKDVNETLLPIVRQYAPEYTQDAVPVTMHDGWSDAIVTALQQLLSRWTNYREAATVAGDFVRGALSYNDRRFKRTTGIDIYSGDLRMQDYLKAATYQNVKLIQSIPTQYLEQVGNIVIGNMRTGMRPSYIEKALTDQFGVTSRRAKFIARDQSAKVTGEMNKVRQVNAGFIYFKWRDSGDSRVRERHEEIANKVTAFGKGVYRWDNLPLSDKGEPIQPGSDYQCFPGTSPVNIFYGAKKAFRHWYSGKLTTLVTESGKRLVCTPNHPVLTDEGFVAAGSLNVGDQLVNVVNQSVDSTDGYSYGSNVSFGELFEACELLGITSKSESRFGSEFHGDITQNEEINVVTFDWGLPNVGDVHSVKNFFELFLSTSDMMVSGSSTPSSGNLSTVLSGLTLAPDSIVSSASKLLSFVTRGFTHADEHRLATIGLLYTSLVENASDDVARSVKFFGDCFDTHTTVDQRFELFKRYILSVMRYAFGLGDLETPGADRFTNTVSAATHQLGGSGECIPLTYKFERIVDKFVSEFWSGHVYNLEMGEGLFVAHDVAVSNCRCVAIPVTETHVKRNQAAGKTNPDVLR